MWRRRFRTKKEFHQISNALFLPVGFFVFNFYFLFFWIQFAFCVVPSESTWVELFVNLSHLFFWWSQTVEFLPSWAPPLSIFSWNQCACFAKLVLQFFRCFVLENSFFFSSYLMYNWNSFALEFMITKSCVLNSFFLEKHLRFLGRLRPNLVGIRFVFLVYSVPNAKQIFVASPLRL